LKKKNTWPITKKRYRINKRAIGRLSDVVGRIYGESNLRDSGGVGNRCCWQRWRVGLLGSEAIEKVTGNASGKK